MFTLPFDALLPTSNYYALDHFNCAGDRNNLIQYTPYFCSTGGEISGMLLHRLLNYDAKYHQHPPLCNVYVMFSYNNM